MLRNTNAALPAGSAAADDAAGAAGDDAAGAAQTAAPATPDPDGLASFLADLHARERERRRAEGNGVDIADRGPRGAGLRKPDRGGRGGKRRDA